MGRALVGLWVLLIAACSGKPAPPSERTATDADERALFQPGVVPFLWLERIDPPAPGARQPAMNLR